MDKDNQTKNDSWERELSSWMDSRFIIPGTNIQFGLDGLIGLIPGIGDMVTNIFGLLIIGSAAKDGVPASILIRMIINSFFDALIGAIPLVGDVFDIFYRSNKKNMDLLQAYRNSPHQVRKRSVIFVSVFLIVLVSGIGALVYGMFQLLSYLIVTIQ